MKRIIPIAAAALLAGCVPYPGYYYGPYNGAAYYNPNINTYGTHYTPLPQGPPAQEYNYYAPQASLATVPYDEFVR